MSLSIGLYFGSFNPIHHGHLIIAEHILNFTNLNEIWFVVSPQNPFKQQHHLLNEYDRLNLVQLAIEQEPRLRSSSIEFKLSKPSYTVHTLAHLAEKYPQHQFSLIMGSDGFQNLPKWKNAAFIIQHYPIYIYQRPGYAVTDTWGAQATILEAPLLEISSTHIRELIADRKSIRFLVPDKVKEEIEKNNYYRNNSEKPSKEKAD